MIYLRRMIADPDCRYRVQFHCPVDPGFTANLLAASAIVTTEEEF
jgi:hypothetical protein